MKQIKYILFIIGMFVVFACSDFDEINTDPKAAGAEQVQVEYFINRSITEAQHDPHIAERAFILYWKTAGRQHYQNGLSTGSATDGWSSDYYGGYHAKWLMQINNAVRVANEQIAAGTIKEYTNNLLQVARIWRAYLLSEVTDNFGPMPLDGFTGTNPDFSSQKDVYYYMLKELKEAAAAIDVNVKNTTASFTQLDRAYGFDFAKWRKYANSMRLRLAMRLSEVDPAKAQSEFEDAANGELILDAADRFTVAERPGWDGLSGVMSREWNSQNISATQNNILIGLGGIPTASVMPAYASAVKEADWMGIKYDQHFSSMTNDPSAGFWFDGLHPVMDPRAYKLYVAPGDFDNPDFCPFGEAKMVKQVLVDGTGAVVGDSIDATLTWNAHSNGEWGDKGAKNRVYTHVATSPRLSQKFRTSASSRIFFAEWETNFLLAEAHVRGWSAPKDAQTAYEDGIRLNFEYWGVSNFVTDYLKDDGYNRAGTSVSWTHTTEPAGTRPMRYRDGYTGAEGVYEMPYPVNTIYKDGAVRNDQLTKVITQKFIAQAPWLPLETWSDHRRLGLPFFENPAVEKNIPTLPALTQSNYKTNSVSFFPQRLIYPSGLKVSNQAGYNQAVGHLGAGGDAVFTPLWWAKH